MALKAKLKEIRGIGDAKADAIMAVVDEHERDSAELERALSMMDKGNYRGGRETLRRYLE